MRKSLTSSHTGNLLNSKRRTIYNPRFKEKGPLQFSKDEVLPEQSIAKPSSSDFPSVKEAIDCQDCRRVSRSNFEQIEVFLII